MKNADKKASRKAQQGAPTDWRNLSPRDKRNTAVAVGAIVVIIVGLLYVVFAGSDFVYREEQQLDRIVNYIFIPLVAIVVLVSLFSKSKGVLITGLVICGVFVYRAMEGIVMFLNVKIGEQKEQMISGTVIEKRMTGNKHITKHYKVKTDAGEVYTFTYEGHVTSYEVNDNFSHLMKRGCFGILYKEFKKD